MEARHGLMAGAGAGSLGPRLAGRLTAELILRSPQYMNCCKDYEIDLRGKGCYATPKPGPGLRLTGIDTSTACASGYRVGRQSAAHEGSLW